MQVFQNIDDNNFRFNGLKYSKNFNVIKLNNTHLSINNAYDTRQELLSSTHYNDIQVNGVVYTSQTACIDVLVPVLFAKAAGGVTGNSPIFNGLVTINGGAADTSLLSANNNNIETFVLDKYGVVTATKFVKSGGTSSQFLKADGTVDSNTYLTSGTVTKAMVGLGNVDNTSDVNKPVSTAQQTAINAKVSDTITNGVTTIAPSQNAVFDALTLKAPLASPNFTGNVGVSGNINIGTGVASGGTVGLTIGNAGVGGTQQIIFTRSTDTAGLKITEPTNDNIKYEFYMSDNPDGGDYFSWVQKDYQGDNGLWQPLYLGGLTNRLLANTNNIYGRIIQNTSHIYTTSDANGNVQINPTNTALIGSNSNALILTPNVTNYTSGSKLYWIKIDNASSTPNTFKWGNTYPIGGTATTIASNVQITGGAQTLNNGITVTFNATTGASLNDTWQFRVYSTPNANTFASSTFVGNVTANAFVKSGGTASQFLKADGTVDSNTYIPTSQKGVANGVATLDSSGHIPLTQLPYESTEVIVASDFLGLPVTGDVNKIYITTNNNKMMRWDNGGLGGYQYIGGAVDSVAGKTGVVTLVKADVGLGNVDNTSDVNKPVSTAQQTALNLKANLNSPNFTGTVSGITKAMVGLEFADNTTDVSKSVLKATKLTFARNINGVPFDGSVDITVNAVDSTPRIASSEKGANNGVATLDSTGVIPIAQIPTSLDDVLEYADLLSLPATGVTGKLYVTLNTNKLYRWNGTGYTYIKSGAVDSVAGKTGVVTLTSADVGLENVNNTSDLQKSVLSATKFTIARTINGVPFDGSVNITVNAVDSTARIATSEKGAANGVATLDGSGVIPIAQIPTSLDDVLEYADLLSLPATGVAGKLYVTLDTNKLYRWSGSAYVYIKSGAVDSVAGKTGVVTLNSTDVGLGNVNNTSDLQKSVLSATKFTIARTINGIPFDGSVNITVPSSDVSAWALASTKPNYTFAEITSKPTTLVGYGITDAAPIANPNFTGTVSGITKAMVGLGNVDNTSDVNKPVSTAQQTALNLKANLNSPKFTGTVSGITKAMVGLGNVDNTTDVSKSVLSATKFTIARTINGVPFDGSVNINIPATDSTPRIATSEKGAANGVATLDSTGLVPSTQLPSYVDDVVEYADLLSFPATGIAGKIYVALNTNKTYRWSGSAYIYITSGAVDSVAGKTGVVTLNGSDVGLGNVNNTSDLQKSVLSATKFTIARTINGVPFDGSVNITVPSSDVSAWALASTKPNYAFSEITSKPTTLAGYGITDNVFKVNGFINDLNTVDKDGSSYWSVGATNPTGGENYGSLLTVIGGNTWYNQIGFGTAGSIGYRQSINSLTGWTSWKYFVHSANVSTYALPINGGTLTGALTGTRVITTGTGNDYALGGIEVKGNGATNTIFPTVGFHQPSLHGASLQLRAANDFRFYNQGATGYANLSVSALTATGDIALPYGFAIKANGSTYTNLIKTGWDGTYDYTSIYTAGGAAGNSGAKITMYNNAPTKIWTDLNVTGDITAYSSSDKRLKDNIQPIENAIEKIGKIGGYTFDWNDKQDVHSGSDVGVIAQEIEQVLPNIVVERENGYKAVKYEKIVALLIEGIKEQQLQINELKKEITELKNK